MKNICIYSVCLLKTNQLCPKKLEKYLFLCKFLKEHLSILYHKMRKCTYRDS